MRHLLISILLLLSQTVFCLGQHNWVFKDIKYSYIVTVDTVLCGGTTGAYCPTVKSIDIFLLQDSKKVQTITPEQFLFDKFLDSSTIFIIEDMNFDGYNDIRLLNWTSLNLQTTYWYWFFNTSTGQFQQDTILGEFKNPHFDQTKKTVHTWWRTGFNFFGHALYKWTDGKLQLIAEEEETWDINPDNPGHLILRRMINGKMVETEKTVKEFTIDYMHHNCTLY